MAKRKRKTTTAATSVGHVRDGVSVQHPPLYKVVMETWARGDVYTENKHLCAGAKLHVGMVLVNLSDADAKAYGGALVKEGDTDAGHDTDTADDNGATDA